MLRRLGLVFAALALFSMAGGQWAVLQSIAWAGMLRDYARQTGSVALAVEQTFDGEHPCELCLGIAAAKQREKAGKDAPASAGEKGSKAEKSAKALVLDDPFFRCVPPAAILTRGVAGNERLTIRAERPPTPPPRVGGMA